MACKCHLDQKRHVSADREKHENRLFCAEALAASDFHKKILNLLRVQSLPCSLFCSGKTGKERNDKQKLAVEKFSRPNGDSEISYFALGDTLAQIRPTNFSNPRTLKPGRRGTARRWDPTVMS